MFFLTLWLLVHYASSEQNGYTKGLRFSQHLNCIFQWALDIGGDSIVKDDGSLRAIKVVDGNNTSVGSNSTNPAATTTASSGFGGTAPDGTINTQSTTDNNNDKTARTLLGEVLWSRNWRSAEEELRELEKMSKDLDLRLKNIWYYVLKATQIDSFVLERLKESEELLMTSSFSSNLDGSSAGIIDDKDQSGGRFHNVATLLTKQMRSLLEKEGIDLLSSVTATTLSSTGVENMSNEENTTENGSIVKKIQNHLDKLRSVVTIPRSKQDEKDACIVYLDKVRVACEIFLLYLILNDNDDNSKNHDADTSTTNGEGAPNQNSRLLLKGCIEKAYNGVLDSFQHLADMYEEEELRRPITPAQGQQINATKGREEESDEEDSSTEKRLKQKQRQPIVLLQDAWNKVMEYDKDMFSSTSNNNNNGDEEEEYDDDLIAAPGAHDSNNKRRLINSPNRSMKKRQKTFPQVIRSKVLLTAGRNTPSHLIIALQSKGAILSKPLTTSTTTASTLKMQFGDAFEMEIYVSPLLVTIRASQKQQQQQTSKATDNRKKNSMFHDAIVNGGLPTWKSPYIGLDHDSGDYPNRFSNNSVRQQQSSNNNQKTQKALRISGRTGTMEKIGPTIVKQLEYASAQATRVLRRCFADICHKAYNSESSSEYEVEVLESSALLKFVTIATNTWTPPSQSQQ